VHIPPSLNQLYFHLQSLRHMQHLVFLLVKSPFSHANRYWLQRSLSGWQLDHLGVIELILPDALAHQDTACWCQKLPSYHSH
jgi:hypothetical protein